MDPSGNSQLFQNLEATASYYHQQGTLNYVTAGDSVLQRRLCASQPDNAYPTVSPMVSENLRQFPASIQTTAQSFLDNTSNNAVATVALGLPNVPLVEGPSSVSFFSSLSDPLAQNSQRQIHDKLQSVNLHPQLGSQFPSFPTRPAAPTQGLPLNNTSAQLAQVNSTPLLATLMQQMLCSSLNASATPMAFLPSNNSSFAAQLMTQLLTAQLAQSTQPGPLAVLLQAFNSMAGSAPAASPLQATAQTSLLSQLPSMDPATAKQTIVILVNQLIQSGNLTDDDTCRHFVEKLQSSSSSSPWHQTQPAVSSSLQANQNVSALHSLCPQTLPITPENIKKEVISSNRDHVDSCRASVNSNTSSLRRSTCDEAGTPVSDVTPSNFAIRVGAASQQYDTEMGSGLSDRESIGCQTKPKTKATVSPGNSRNTAKRTRISSNEELSKISMKSENNTTGTLQKVGDKGRSKNNLKGRGTVDLSERTESSEEFQTSGIRLRNRRKTVKYCEEELSDWVEHSDDDTDVRPKKKNTRAHSNCHNSTVKGTETIAAISCSLTASSSILVDVASCRSATDSQAVVKNEITGPISVLPMVNICHSPNVRYLFMGRKNDGMDWLNLVSYKTKESDDSVNQCLFCPMTSSEVKPVADHIANEHSDLDFVLRNIKQPNGRVTYLACRHCNYLIFEPTLMWIHFELYHGIPGIMDGSSLPQIKISDPVNVEEISLDKPVNSRGSQPAYVCLDCMLCSSNSKNVATHVLQAHPDTVNFNGCFVKLMMIKGKEKDSFTFREALYDESYADALKDVYVCMLCQYSTYGAYLAMSHSLRLHQTKRLLFICSECEYQCTQESNLMMHMASTHQCSSISSFMCSVTLIATLSDGTFAECKIPSKREKISDNPDSCSDSEMKSNSIIQSTAVSSSQEKQKSRMLTGHENSPVTPQNNLKMVSLLSRKVNVSTKKKKKKKKTVLPSSAVMPILELEMKARNEYSKTSTGASEKAPKLKPVRHS